MLRAVGLSASVSCPLSCNSHGRCKSMQFLAATDNDRFSEYEKESAKHSTTGYGNYLYTDIWDFDKMYGCECDEGYTGYDCSLRYCPTGDDPLTDGQVNEIQQITCQGTADYTITYKGKTTARIAATAPSTAVETEIEKLTTVEEVSVIFPTGTTQACQSGTATMTIEFIKDFGQLPLMTVDSSAAGGAQLNTMTIVRTQRCTKEEESCGGRGKCDFLTGTCGCHPNYRTR